MSKFNVGDKVRYIGKDHREMPEFYPEIGTIGTVVKEDGDADWYIQWPKGSTSRKDCWCCYENDIELVEDVDMTNEEIWKMLEPKMVKNGFCYSFAYDNNNVEYEIYSKGLVFNLIALAYRSGYERAMKGRPFKIGEKKKGGHWEPVAPKNLPKEGTKVRYSRKCGKYKDNIIKIGDTGTVVFEGVFTPLWFGMKPDKLRSGRT